MAHYKYIFEDRKVMTCKLDNGFRVDVTVEKVKGISEIFVSFYLYHIDYGIKMHVASLPVNEITKTDNPNDLQFHEIELKNTIDTMIEQFDSINDYIANFDDYKIV